MAKNIELVRQEVAAMRNEVEDFANSAERVGGVVSDVLEYGHEQLTDGKNKHEALAERVTVAEGAISAEVERAQSAEELISQQAELNFRNFSDLGVEESAKIDGYEIALTKKTNTAGKTKVKVPVYDMQNPSATPVGLVDEIFVEDMKAEAKKMVDAEAERAKAKEQEIEGKVAELESEVVTITAKDLIKTTEVQGDGQSVKFVLLGKVEKERPIRITSSQPITGTIYLYKDSDYSGSYEILGRFIDSSESSLIVNEEGYIKITSVIGLNISVVFSLYTSLKYAKEDKLEKYNEITQQKISLLTDNSNYTSKASVVENSGIYTYFFNYRINGEKVNLVSAKAISGTVYLAEAPMVNIGEKVASLVEDSIIEIERKVGYIFVTSKQESELYLFTENKDNDNIVKRVLSKRYLIGTGLDNVLQAKFETTPTCIGGVYKLKSTIQISGTVYLYDDSSYSGSFEAIGYFNNSTEVLFKAESQGFVKITTRLAEGVNAELSMYANLSLLCLGDSLTFGSGTSESGGVRLKAFPFLLANKTGFTAINGGYPSDTAKNVAARCNAMPYYFSSDFMLPKDGSLVQIGTYGYHNIYSSDDRKMINLGYFSGGIGKNAGCSNPCYIIVDGEIIPIEIVVQSSTNMAVSTDKVVVRRLNTSEKDLLIKKGMVIYTIMSFYKDADCLTLWIGTNGDLLGEELLNYCKTIIGFFNTGKVIIIGSHYPYNDNLSSIEETEYLLQREFGVQYFNLRDYIVNYGLYDANLIPTEEDEEYINLGKCPPQLLSDGVHFTEKGYNIIASQLYLKGKLLGYWI